MLIHLQHTDPPRHGVLEPFLLAILNGADCTTARHLLSSSRELFDAEVCAVTRVDSALEAFTNAPALKCARLPPVESTDISCLPALPLPPSVLVIKVSEQSRVPFSYWSVVVTRASPFQEHVLSDSDAVCKILSSLTENGISIAGCRLLHIETQLGSAAQL